MAKRKSKKKQQTEFTALLVLIVYLLIVKLLDTIVLGILNHPISLVASSIIFAILAVGLLGVYKKKVWGWWTTVVITAFMGVIAVVVMPFIFSILALVTLFVEIAVIILCIRLKPMFK